MTRLISMLIAATAANVAAADPPATLAEVVRSAIASHETVARAESEVRRADATVRLSTSALLPRLELNGAWTRYGDEQSIEFAPGETFVIRPLTDWSWSADLRQTLFYGLRDWRARDVALLRRDIARLERAVTVADLALRTSAAYFDAVAAAERVAVHRSTLEQIREQLRVAGRRFEVGEVTSADVARWRAEEAAEVQQLVGAEGTAALAMRRLARLAGVAELPELAPPGRVPAPDGEMAALVETALDERLEMAVLRHQMEASRLMITVEKDAWLPELEAHAQYYQQKAEFPSQDWTSLTLGLTVPVFDGGLTAARVAEAKEDLRQVEILGREVIKAVTDDVESAAILLETAEAALVAARERLEAAGAAHDQTERAYRVGEASATDLLATTASLTDARTAAIIARWERELAAIALRRAVGRPALPDLEPIAEEDQQS